MSREKQFVKNLIILIFGTVLPKLSFLITMPIVTRDLTKSEYGVYDLVTTLVSLLLPVVTLQIQSAAFRFLIESREDKSKSKTIISTIIIFSVSVSLGALLIMFFCLHSIDLQIRIIICLYFLVDILFRIVQQVIRGYSMNKEFSISSTMESLINLALIVFFSQLGRLKLIEVLLAVTIAEIVAILYALKKSNLISQISIKCFSLPMLKEMLHYSWPMVPNGLSAWVLKFSDRVVLTFFMGASANAVYAVATKLPNILSTIQNSFTMAWQENASVSVEDKDVEKYYSNMFDQVNRFMAGVTALLIATTPICFWLLIKGDYNEAYVHIPILYMAAYFDTIKAYLGGIYVAKKRTKSVGTTTVIAAIINLGIDLILIHQIGIFAASISTLISCAFLALYRMYDVQKIQKISYDMSRFIKTIMILTVMCLLCGMRKSVLDICNILVGIGVALLWNRKIIVSLLAMVKKRI